MPRKRAPGQDTASVQFDSATYALITALAAQDDRSTSSLIRLCVSRWLSSSEGREQRRKLSARQKRVESGHAAGTAGYIPPAHILDDSANTPSLSELETMRRLSAGSPESKFVVHEDLQNEPNETEDQS